MNKFRYLLKKSKKIFNNYLKHSAKQPQMSVADEWLTDNAHTVSAALKTADNALTAKNADRMYRLYRLWLDVCGSTLPDTDKLVLLLSTHELDLSDCALLPVVAAATYACTAAENIRTAAADPEAEKKICECIKSLNALKNTDFEELTVAVCRAEQYLRYDPSGDYINMSSATKTLYRNAVILGAKKAGVPEHEFANGALKKAQSSERGKDHIGFFLPIYKDRRKRAVIFIVCEFAASLAVTVICAALMHLPFIVLLMFFPVYEALLPAAHAAERRFFPARTPCRMDEDVPLKERTLIVTSGILPSQEGAGKLFEHLLELYTANRECNVRVMLLLDMKTAKTPNLPEDSADIAAVKRLTDRLNEEYPGRFLTAIRERSYSPTEGEYTGHERKRGAITALMQYLRDGDKSRFSHIFGNTDGLTETRFVMALDSDTRISFGSLKKLAATALHPLNRPVTDKSGRVISGYGCIVPRCEVSLEASEKTFFTRLFTEGGTLSYAPVISERSMDMFGCSLFTGKGLIDVDAFNSAVGDRFENGRILSHDIPEGAMLRTAFVGECEITEEFPQKPGSYFMRLHRWIRGDIQNAVYILRPIIRSGSVHLPATAKYHIAENLRRALTPIFAWLCLIASPFVTKTPGVVLFVCAILSECSGTLFSAVSSVLRRGINNICGLRFSGGQAYAAKTLLRTAIYAGLLPQKAAVCADASLKAATRMLFTHKKLLQWTTASQADKKTVKNPLSCFCIPWSTAVLLFIKAGLPGRLFAVLIFICSLFSATDGIKQKTDRKIKLSPNDRDTVRSFAAASWRFFEVGVTAEENHLPPDNIQETPVYKTAHRTSPTNIGLYLISVMAARDMGLISNDEMLTRLSLTLKTVEKLKKYNGCLYNWYDTRTLEPLTPQYISTVDCGNLLCCLVALKEGLKEPDTADGAQKHIAFIQTLLELTDMSFLYDKKRDLFRIGFDVQSKTLSEPFYDLYMSEARMTSYYETAKRHVPPRHMGLTGRMLLKCDGYTCRASWTGTMFEFFMPTLFIPVKENSVEHCSLKVCLHAQKKRMGKLPYGISESCFYSVDSASDYRYKAHGISALALKRGADDEPVVSPYSTFLTMPFDFRSAMKNLSALSALHMQGAYGFYEAIDFTPSRTDGEEYRIVRCYMAHHVGMSMAAMANTLLDGIFVKRFMRDRDMASAESLLCEKPISAPALFKKPSYRTNTPENKSNTRREAESKKPREVRAYGNGWLLVADRFGRNRSLYSSYEPLKYSDRCAGLTVAVKHGSDTAVLNTLPETAGKLTPTAFITKNNSDKLCITAALLTHRSEPAMLVPVKLKNNTNEKLTARISFCFEPSLLPSLTEDPHPAFSDMFLRASYNENRRTFNFERVNLKGVRPALCAGFYSAEKFFFATDRETMLPRDPDRTAPVYFAENTRLSPTVSPAAAMTVSLTLAPGESKEHVLILTCGTDKTAASASLEKIRSAALPELSKGGKDIFSYNGLTADCAEELLKGVFFSFNRSAERDKATRMLNADRNALWQAGISGDLPIITLIANKDVSSSLLGAFAVLHKRLNSVGIKNDLVILKNIPGDYYSAEDRELNTVLKEQGLADSKGKSGGIHSLCERNISADTINAIKAFSALIYPENEKLPIEFFPPVRTVSENALPAKNTCGFTENGFTISQTPPLPWCHTLSNRTFGTLASDGSLGYSWALNSRQNKLTPWSNDTSSDLNGERLFADINGKIYDCIKGSSAEFTDSFILHSSVCGKVTLDVKTEIPERGMKKRITVTARNSGDDCELSLIYAVTPQMSERYSDRRFVCCRVTENGIICHNPVNGDHYGHMLLCCNTDTVKQVTDDGTGKKAVLKSTFALGKGESKTTVFTMCFAKTERSLYKLRDVPFIKMHRKRINIHTGDRMTDRFASALLLHQVYDTRLQARCGFYQCSGAFGFRDQLQDILPLTVIYPDICREIIAKMCAVQFKQGDVLHWYHPVCRDGKMLFRGVRTNCSDDMLWLPYAVAKYVKDTGDSSVLNMRIPFLEGRQLRPGEHDIYDAYRHGDEKATLYEHCLLCFEKAARFGSHSLPLILGGDWNDGFSELGKDGKGESVWLAMFMRDTAIKFAKICDIMHDGNSHEKLLSLAASLAESCNTHAWAGDRYLRAFADDGTAIGKAGDSACAVDLTVQAWAQLSNTDKDKAHIALTTAYRELYDTENGIVKLFSPPFTHNTLRAGYINDYPPGVRENGGQYTHAAVWFLSALRRAGMYKEADRILHSLIPAGKYTSEYGTQRYKTEPYALAGDVYSAPGLEGRGGWSLYTGSAGWLLQELIEFNNA